MAISYKYLQKLQREVAAYSEWLADTRPDPDGQAKLEDLQNVFTKANAIYLKALALYRATAEESETATSEEPGQITLMGG